MAFFTMRNKLRLRKKCEDVSCPSQEEHALTTEVVTSVSCFNDETSPGRHSGSLASEDTQVASSSNSTRKVGPFQEQRTPSCAKDIKIAPIFVHATQHSNSKRDGRRGRPAEKLRESALRPRTEDEQLGKIRSRLSTVSHLTERKRSRRGRLSPSALRSCLQEIQTSNPTCPVHTMFSALQKKARGSPRGATEPQSCQQNHLKEKRKLGGEREGERLTKRLRSGLTAVAMGYCHVSPSEGVQESVKKQQGLGTGNPAGLENHCEPDSGPMNLTESHSMPLKNSDLPQTDLTVEDIPWTDKYSPQHSSEVIGNSASVNKLQIWLKKWKLRADCDERRKMEARKREENTKESWDCGDFQGEAGPEDDREEPLCNAMLITGPPGLGKTASVYACAQEFGFKVFEVNSSSQRSGRHVLSQLKEATQSHLVEMSGKDSLKPAYFNNYHINSCTPKSETLPGKAARPKSVTSDSKPKFSRSGRKGKANPATVTLANYFKTKAKADHLSSGGLSPWEKPDSEKSGDPSPGSDQTEPQNKKIIATSLILFEEVDVIFDDDVGFLAAIKTFMKTTKRPVVLTTNDPSFRGRFSCSLEEIIYKTPSLVNVCSYLQLVGLAENVRLESDDVFNLVRLSRGDVRRCLLQLQLWVHSGGGRASGRGGSLKEPAHVQYSSGGDDVESQLPHCDPGCTASMLGLHPVTQNHLFNLLKRQFWSEVDTNLLLGLLAESWRGGVPLLYSNLELLLPVGTEGTCSGPQKELPPSDNHIKQLDGNINGKASGTNSNPVRKISRLSRKRYITAASDASCSTFPENPQRASFSSKRAPSSRDKTEENAAKVATNCLVALTDFFDLMSYLDSTLPAAAASLVSDSGPPETFVWTGAEIKDGLLDEMSEDEEAGRIWSQERVLDIQAVVEGLACHRCCWRASLAWTEAQKYGQELGDTRWGRLVEVSSKRQSLSFSFQPLCAPSVSRRRYELSRKVLASKSFSLLGNRRAVCVDYLPVLRYICRFQRTQEENEEPVRCLNYLSSKRLHLSKSTFQLLAEDFR